MPKYLTENIPFCKILRQCSTHNVTNKHKTCITVSAGAMIWGLSIHNCYSGNILRQHLY